MLYLSSAIAIELCKNKTPQEIAELKILLSQICCSINALTAFEPCD